MEVLHREIDTSIVDLKDSICSHYKDSFICGQDFERIDSLGASHDSSKIKSILIPYNPEEDEFTNRMRQETYLEKVRNIGTNLKFNIQNISQLICKPDNGGDDKAYLLGKEIRIEDQSHNSLMKIEEEVSKIIWFSYRKKFPILNHQEIKSNETYISDTSWGCMIRSCQMALAAGLKRSLPPINPYLSNIKSPDCDIISWFLDIELDPKKAPYSIQTISKFLYEDYKLKPGVWLKASNVLLSLDKIQQTYGTNTNSNLHLVVFLEGTVYINELLRKVVSEIPLQEEDELKEEFETEFENVEDEDGPCSHTDIDYSLLKLKTQVSLYREYSTNTVDTKAFNEMERLKKLKWKGPLMFVVLAKIGLEKPNPEYFPCIKKLLSFPESLGIIGGPPGQAYFMIGYVQDMLICLDPHFVQDSVRVIKNNEDIKSYYGSPRYVRFCDIDTSVGMAFYIKDERQFDTFVNKFKTLCQDHDSFLGLEIDIPGEELSDFESVGEEDEFETVSYK